MTWQFDWITNWDEIWGDDFVAEWQEWMRNSSTAHVFFHPVLVRVWAESYARFQRVEPRFLVARRDGYVVFLPLVIWRKGWKNASQRLLIPMGYSDYDYHDPILVGPGEDFSWSEFWNEFRRRVTKELHTEYDMVRLSGMHAPVAQGKDFIRESDTSPWCDLSEFHDGEAFLRSLGKSLRGDIRRQERRISEMGELEYKVFHSADGSETFDVLRDFLDAHTQRWPQAYKIPDFHHNLIRLGVPTGVTHFSVLKIAGDIVAWHLGFVDAGRFYYYMPAHKTEYANLSPGKILLYYCIKDAIHQKLKIFDLLRGEESYKAGWTNRMEQLYTFQFSNQRTLSWLHNFAADRIKRILVKMHGH